MRIGNVEIKNNLFLAPMAGITDKTYRTICSELGAGLVCTEMISAKGLFYGDCKTSQLMDINYKNEPVSMQIFGSDPEIMEKIVIEKLNKLDTFQILDINMGCPAPKIVKNGDGSALMRTPYLAKEIMNRVKKASNKPVTVKIRKGWDDNEINFLEFGDMAEKSGLDAITIHGRTRDQFYSGKADWESIKLLKKHLNIPVIGNGDVYTHIDAIKMMEYTECDGIMIGRGALGNPWIFKSTLEYINNGKAPSQTGYLEKFQMILKHLDLLILEKPEKIAVLQLRKHCGWYVKGLYGAAEMRDQFNKVNTKKEISELIASYIEKLNKNL